MSGDENVRGTIQPPDPAGARDLAEFIDALGMLRLWAGGPSYRVLAKRVGLFTRPPRKVAHTTVSGIFQPQRRRLDLDTVTAVVRALGLSETDVARWRQAHIRVCAEAKTGGAAGVLRQLPPDLAVFTGRAAELDELLAAVRRRERGDATTAAVCVIEGMAGVGKTRLAVHLAHLLVRSGRYDDAQLYADLRGFDPDQPPVSPTVVLRAFLRTLEVPTRLIPESLAERSAMFRDRIRNRRALILLDNAADESQVRELIPAAPGCLVIITTRRTMADLGCAAALRLDVLDPSDSRALLGRIAGNERLVSEPAAAAAVTAACGHLPLAVSCAAGRLRSRPDWSTADLLAELRGARSRTMPVRGRSVARAFDTSLARLDDEQRRAFLLLGLCPGKDMGAEAAAIMAKTATATARELLESLVDENLVLSPTAGRFTLHPALRGYAAVKAAHELPEPERRASLRRVLHWYTSRLRDTAGGRPLKARRLLAQVPALAASDGSGLSAAWRAVGHAHLWSEEFEAAESAYRRALNLTPADGDQTPALLGIRQAFREQYAHAHPAGPAPKSEHGDRMRGKVG